MRRSLNRSLNQRRNRYAASMRGGARRPRPDADFADIFRHFKKYFEVCKRMARADPHLFGPEARAYFRETVAEYKWAVTVDAALDRVYGPLEPGQLRGVDEVWSQAYPNFQNPAEKAKWIKNWSGFRKQKNSDSA